MRRRPILVPLALAAAVQGPVLAQQPSPPPTPSGPVFPGGVEQVVVDVVVVDDRGQPVTGLSAADFVLSEDGASQEILSFEAVGPEGEAPAAGAASRAMLTRAFGVVFDDLHLTPAAGERVKSALDQVLRALRGSDEVALVRTGSPQAWAGRVGEDGAALRAAIAGLRGLRARPKSCEMSDEEAMRIHVERDVAVRRMVFDRLVTCRVLIRPPVPLAQGPTGQAASPPVQGGEGQIETWAAEQHQRSMERIRSTYRTLESLLRALSPLRGRKSVILASEGFVRDRGLDSVKGVVAAAGAANAAVYFLDARDAGGWALTRPADAPAAPAADERERLSEGRFFAAEATELLAEDTGGAVIRGAELGAGLRRLVDESRSYYLLGYTPRQPALDGRFRAIRVEVRRPGLRVRARRGYYAVPRAGPPPANVAAILPSTARDPTPAPPALPAADAPGAPGTVADWGPEQVARAVAALESSGASDDVIEKAVLAHSAAATAEGPREHHARAAAQAAGLVRDPRRRRDLEKSVLLGLAHRYLEGGRWPVAEELAARAAGRLDDADSLLALGAIQETTGSVVDGGRRPRADSSMLTAGLDEMVRRNPVTGFASGVPGGPGGRTPEFRSSTSRAGPLSAQARLRRAAETYRKALKADPNLHEARLRLGRTLALLGDERSALAELEAIPPAAAPELRYLARLFAGDLKEQEGDPSGAAVEYRAALAIRPHAAVGRLALARALHLGGERSGGQAELQALLLEPGPDPIGDPWWRYRLRPLGRWADALAERRP